MARGDVGEQQRGRAQNRTPPAVFISASSSPTKAWMRPASDVWIRVATTARDSSRSSATRSGRSLHIAPRPRAAANSSSCTGS